MPLRIALTYTLTVRATTPAKDAGFQTFPPHMSARAKARPIMFSGFWISFLIRFPLSGSDSREVTSTLARPPERRRRPSPGAPGRHRSLASVPSLRTGRRQRTKMVAPPATTDSSAGSSTAPQRGGRFTTIQWTRAVPSDAHASKRGTPYPRTSYCEARKDGRAGCRP